MEIIVNEQLTLTPFDPADKPNLLKYLNDPVVYANTVHIPSPYTEADADEWLRIVADRREKLGGTVANFAIRHRTEGLIGGIGLFVHTGLDGHRDELGYWLAQPFRNQGIMTEVVRRFTAFQFENRPNLLRMEALVFTHNLASMRLLEKVGYAREGLLRKIILKKGQPMDAVMLAFVRE